MLEKGKEYNFDYQTIKFKSSSDNIKEINVVLEVIIPQDYDYLYPDDPYLLKYKIQNTNDEEYVYIKYYDKPTLRGKWKWKLNSSKFTDIRINDLPTAVDSSLNTFQEPSKRKWFKHKNFGLSDEDYEQLNWDEWVLYPLMIEYNDITLLYRIVCDIIKRENPKEKDFTFLKGKVGECFLLNYPYKMKDDVLEEYHQNYLRDIMKLW